MDDYSVLFARSARKELEAIDGPLEEYGAMGMDSRLTLIQELIPLGLMHI